jgi:phage terminase Nu1 subunit (DNA packaging protein)
LTVAPKPRPEHVAEARRLFFRVAHQAVEAHAAKLAECDDLRYRLANAQAATQQALDRAERMAARLETMRAENARLRDELHRERYVREPAA